MAIYSMPSLTSKPTPSMYIQSKVKSDQEMLNAEPFLSIYPIQKEQQFQLEYEIQNTEMCGNCGNTSMCPTRCHSCPSKICNMCMDHEGGCCIECLKMFPEPFLPKYQIQNEQQFQFEYEIQHAEMCGNCGNASMCTTRCHSCPSKVCNMCMDQEEGCCIDCLKTFPKPSPTNYQVQNEQQFQSEYEIQNAEMCGNCGNASMCATRCHSCPSKVCNMCMDQEEGCCSECPKTFLEPSLSNYQVQNEQQFQSEYEIQHAEMCGNCGNASMCAMRCHSCSSKVCNTCMDQEEGCCIECLNSFPVSPCMGASMTRMLSATIASPVLFAQKHRIDLNDCLAHNACPASIACSGPTQLEYIATASESTALSWADMSESGSSIASSEPATTTMMICNIPCRFGQADVVEAIHSVGFADKYDFVFLPSRTGKHNANIGYAFVDFKSASNAERFADAFENFQFPGTRSSKTCTVKHAHRQGYNAAPSRQSKRA